MIDKEYLLNEHKKMYNAKRLEFEALTKTTAARISFLEKKIDQQQESLSQSAQWLADEEKKLHLANDKLIEARRSNQDMANKLTYYKCEEDIKIAEIETLKEQKR